MQVQVRPARRTRVPTWACASSSGRTSHATAPWRLTPGRTATTVSTAYFLPRDGPPRQTGTHYSSCIVGFIPVIYTKAQTSEQMVAITPLNDPDMWHANIRLAYMELRMSPPLLHFIRHPEYPVFLLKLVILNVHSVLGAPFHHDNETELKSAPWREDLLSCRWQGTSSQ